MRISGALGLFYVKKLVQHSDIVYPTHIWYGNHTIFGKIKVYFIPYILCTIAFCVRVYGESPNIPAGKDEKDWNTVRTDFLMKATAH